jgi:hypothetical protein
MAATFGIIIIIDISHDSIAEQFAVSIYAVLIFFES